MNNNLNIFKKIILFYAFFLTFNFSNNVDAQTNQEITMGQTIRQCLNWLSNLKLGSNISNLFMPYHPEGIRPATKYLSGNKEIQIHYWRTSWIPDNQFTDDEYTPVIFENGILIAVGWDRLGGPKTMGDRYAVERQRRWHREQIDREIEATRQFCRALNLPYCQ